jgi:hypothetical protein
MNIVEMAKQANIDSLESNLLGEIAYMEFSCDMDGLKAFAALVAAQEREACAAMFDNRNVWDEEVGERIRARRTP